MDQFNDYLKKITELYENQKEINKTLKSEQYKDAEMAAMRRELDRYKEKQYLGFPLTQEQFDKIKAWQDKHERKVHHNQGIHGACGGGYTYMFYPTALGCSIKCRCHACHMNALNEGAVGYKMFESAWYNQYMREYDAVIDFDDF